MPQGSGNYKKHQLKSDLHLFVIPHFIDFNKTKILYLVPFFSQLPYVFRTLFLPSFSHTTIGNHRRRFRYNRFRYTSYVCKSVSLFSLFSALSFFATLSLPVSNCSFFTETLAAAKINGNYTKIGFLPRANSDGNRRKRMYFRRISTEIGRRK